ncbi:MAG: hypothetical protein V8R10_13250 [Christensenellales bacterium]
MDAQLRKETVTMEQVTAHGASQAVVEGEITLPGGLREETHVLHAGGMAVVDSAESGADRATLSGKVIFHVLYTQGAPNQVHVVEATADFYPPVRFAGRAAERSRTGTGAGGACGCLRAGRAAEYARDCAAGCPRRVHAGAGGAHRGECAGRRGSRHAGDCPAPNRRQRTGGYAAPGGI